MNERNILINLVFIVLFFFVFIEIAISQTCDSCSNPCTINCNDPQSHWNEIPVGIAYYFTYTLDSSKMVYITMRPDPNEIGGPNYNLFTSWTADTCYHQMPDCGTPSGGGLTELCSQSNPLPAGTYYFEVYHQNTDGNGFDLLLECET